MRPLPSHPRSATAAEAVRGLNGGHNVGDGCSINHSQHAGGWRAEESGVGLQGRGRGS
jgi:hypothetical protein